MHQLTLQIFSEIKQNYFKETKENIYYTLATLDIAGHELFCFQTCFWYDEISTDAYFHTRYTIGPIRQKVMG